MNANFTREQREELLDQLDRLQWLGCDGEPYGGCSSACPECAGEAPRVFHVPARRIDAYTRVEAHDERTGGHLPDCKLAALLSKYGRAAEYASQRQGKAEDE